MNDGLSRPVWIKPGTDHREHCQGEKQHGKIRADAAGSRAALDHQRAHRIHFVGQRIDVSHRLEPIGHDGDGIHGVAGEKQRHGQDLPDAHEAFPGFDDAGDDQ